MFKMRTVQDLYEHISYVLLSAPDQFPVEDFLKPEDQMTLEKSFLQLREGVEIAYPEEEFAERREALCSMLDKALVAYRAHDRPAGAQTLQEFEAAIFRVDR
jgi:hypothetical protein